MTTLYKKYQDRQAVWRKAPEKYLKDVHNYLPWEKQLEIIDSVKNNKKTIVRSCNGAGKTSISAMVAQWFLDSFAPAIVITTAPTFRQVRDLLWGEINSHRLTCKLPKMFKGSVLDLAIKISPEWYALGFSTDKPEQFQGYHSHNILVIKDEAAGINPILQPAIDGILTTSNAKELEIGNPTSPSGLYYEHFRNPLWSKISISCFDTPNFTEFNITMKDIRNGNYKNKINNKKLSRPYLITPDWVYERFLEWGEDNPLFQARCFGQFPIEGKDTLIPLTKIEQAVNRKIDVLEKTKHIGSDIARYGDDETIIVSMQSKKMLGMEMHNKQSLMKTTGNIVNFCDILSAKEILIDDTGLGGGVTDRLKELDKFHVIPLNFGAAPKNKEKFVNLKAEMLWYLRECFLDDSISIIKDELLVSQLSGIRWKILSNGKIAIESKDEIKKRGLKSPDRAEALAIANYFNFLKSFKSSFADVKLDKKQGIPLSKKFECEF